MLWAAAVLPPLVVVWVLSWYPGDPAFDYDRLTYLRGVTDILAGRSPYAPWQLAGPYDITEAGGGEGFVYPPSAAVVLAPLVWDTVVWRVLSLAVFVAGIAVWARGPMRTALILWLLAVTRPFPEAVLIGSNVPLLAGVLGLVARYPRWSWLAAGLGGAVKLYPVTWAVLGSLRPGRVSLGPDADTRNWYPLAEHRDSAGMPSRTASPPATPTERLALARAALPPIILTAATLGATALIALLAAGPRPWSDFLAAYGNAQPSCKDLPSVVCAGFPSWVGYAGAVALTVSALRLGRLGALWAVTAAFFVATPDMLWSQTVLIVPAVAGLIGSPLAGRVRAPASASARTRPTSATGSFRAAPARRR